MPPRAFPFPLRVGTDLCHIPRIKAILTRNVGKTGKDQKRPLTQFLSKLLTWPERQYFWDRFKHPEYAYRNIDNVAQYLAGRWAAKEACRKACPHLNSSNGFHNIMILPIHMRKGTPSGASIPPQGLILHEWLPSYRDESSSKGLSGRGHFDIDTVDGQFCEISISHDAQLATAVALVPYIEGEPGGEQQKILGRGL